MTHSMTGFSTAQGHSSGFDWSWELRAVNGKSLDLRLRVPDWVDGLEPQTRAMLNAAFARGNVQVQCKVAAASAAETFGVNHDGLNAALDAVEIAARTAEARGLQLTPPTPAEILGLRGVMDTKVAANETSALKTALLDGLKDAVVDMQSMRFSEGSALQTVLEGQVDTIATLTDEIEALLGQRREEINARFQSALEKVKDNVDPDRLAQEIAVLAVKADVTEEVDRLRAHITAAQDLLSAQGAKGRKLDFLSQEFNREATTLCAKSQHTGLTALGVELKATIDQFREQIQNVE